MHIRQAARTLDFFADAVCEETNALDQYSKTLYADITTDLSHRDKVMLRDEIIYARVTAKQLHETIDVFNQYLDSLPRWKQFILRKLF